MRGKPVIEIASFVLFVRNHTRLRISYRYYTICRKTMQAFFIVYIITFASGLDVLKEIIFLHVLAHIGEPQSEGGIIAAYS